MLLCMRTPGFRPVTFSLQFRGQADWLEGELRKRATAPGCALVTSVTADGLAGHFVFAPDDDEALFEARLAFYDKASFEEEGTIAFSRANTVRLDGRGQLDASPDRHLRHGSVMSRVVGGQGTFDGARGLITSNFLLSDTGELTENQLGVMWTPLERVASPSAGG
jgi:hypothetical protein